MDSEFCVIDVETTGFSPRLGDRVLEVAAVRMRGDGTVLDTWSALVNPGRDIGATHVHGITAGEVLDAPQFGQVAGASSNGSTVPCSPPTTSASTGGSSPQSSNAPAKRSRRGRASAPWPLVHASSRTCRAASTPRAVGSSASPSPKRTLLSTTPSPPATSSPGTCTWPVPMASTALRSSAAHRSPGGRRSPRCQPADSDMHEGTTRSVSKRASVVPRRARRPARWRRGHRTRARRVPRPAGQGARRPSPHGHGG